jgi:hypothetical protein
VPACTREIVATLQADPRVRFFDHPKGPRTGEIYRAAALAEARGEIVCYLSDDDLWLPTHVETLRELLADADFAHALPTHVAPDGSISSMTVDLALAADRELLLSGKNPVPLTFGAHTLNLYRRLPHGWRTTPHGIATDLYMWQQILSTPGCRAVSGTRPTALLFPSPERRTMTLDERCAEMDRFVERLDDPALVAEVYEAVVRDRARQVAELRTAVEEVVEAYRLCTGGIEIRDESISTLQRELVEQTARVERSIVVAADHERLIRRLERELAEQTTLAERAIAELKQRDRVIGELEERLNGLRGDVLTFVQAVAEQNERMRELHRRRG